MIRVKDCRITYGLLQRDANHWELEFNPRPGAWLMRVRVSGNIDFAYYEGEWYVADEWFARRSKPHEPEVCADTLQVLDEFVRLEMNSYD